MGLERGMWSKIPRERHWLDLVIGSFSLIQNNLPQLCLHGYCTRTPACSSPVLHLSKGLTIHPTVTQKPRWSSGSLPLPPSDLQAGISCVFLRSGSQHHSSPRWVSMGLLQPLGVFCFGLLFFLIKGNIFGE